MLQPAYKPGFVENDHLSSLLVAKQIKRLSIYKRITSSVNLLAASRVYLLSASPQATASSYLARFTFSLVFIKH